MKGWIAFKNFRRFREFPELEYGGITYLVGRNNAGKSTMVKALLLIHQYLNQGDFSRLYFTKYRLEDVNIMTYERAKSKDAEEDVIHFRFGFMDHSISLEVTGSPEKDFAQVRRFAIKAADEQIKFIIDPVAKTIKGQIEVPTGGEWKLEKRVLPGKEKLDELIEQIKSIKKEIKSFESKRTEKRFIELKSELKKLEDRKKLIEPRAFQQVLLEGSPTGMTIAAEVELGYYHEMLHDTLRKFISDVRSMSLESLGGLPMHRGKTKPELKKIFENYKLFQIVWENEAKSSIFDENYIEYPIDDFFMHLRSRPIHYLGASSSKQRALFSIHDKENALAQAIHLYHRLDIQPGDVAERFVLKWMQEEDGFELGEDFEITQHAGSAYELNVKSHGLSIPLSDKGMGSIQAMLLILRLACIIHQQQWHKKYPLVIIEEPELNLHPALQSRLTDMFLEVYEEHGISVMVETHSEYMIRRTQVIVAEQDYGGELGANPFSVLYFPKDPKTPPYRLEHQEDGTFDRSFGPGFLDEASNHTLDLIRLKRKKEKK